MEYSHHGGECCGYGHIHGFDDASIAELDECIADHRRAAGGNNRILEAILSERQVNLGMNDRHILAEVRAAGGWPVILAQRGFRLAAQWVNSNTGRRCYQFLQISELLTDNPNHRPPFGWDGAVVEAQRGNPPAPPAPPPVRSVSVEYYARLAQLGRRGPFITLGDARAAYPRCRRFEQRTIMSDGSSVWMDRNNDA